DRYQGDFAYSTIHDCLNIADGVISHASSAVLDSIYAGRPTAVLDNDWASLGSLPQVGDLAGMQSFVDRLDDIDPVDNDVHRHFGDLDENLDRASAHIEEMMTGRAAR
ncbi:MAG: hypothetical protein ACC631_03655, partial [Halocynthiibacter sp.]